MSDDPRVLRTVRATRYVMPLREGGSMPGLVEADDDGLYVLKFRGAGQGVKALVAEVVGGELARAAGLPVPEYVLVDLDPALGRAEPDPEIQELITASAGLNVGLDFLPGALPFTPAVDVPAEQAAEVVWVDTLITNVDRTPRNPNIVCWHGEPWLIDHGAALYMQHRGLDPAVDAVKPFPVIRDHVLLSRAGSVEEAGERLAAKVTPEVIATVLDLVWDAWLDAGGGRAIYHDYLVARLAHAPVFAAEAEAARG